MPVRPLNRTGGRLDKRQLAWGCLLAVCATALAGAGGGSGREPETRNAPSLSVLNEKGKSVRLASLKKDPEVLALIFVASTCPVTNLYWERIKGLWYNYRERGVRIILVGGNSDDSIGALQKKIEEHDLEIPLIWDEKHSLAQKLAVEFTPEAVVLGKNWELLYCGRLDDSWKDETRVQQRHLDAAITAALNGQKTADHTDAPFMGSRLR